MPELPRWNNIIYIDLSVDQRKLTFPVPWNADVSHGPGFPCRGSSTGVNV